MFHCLHSNTEFPPPRQPPRRRLALASLLTVLSSSILSLTPSLAQEAQLGTPAQQARTTSPFVGSAMAVLATLEEADVLPPEGTREADRVIKFAIQLQSAFAKSSSPAIQQFLHHTMQRKHGTATEALLERFHSTGWTAELLEALSETTPLTSDEELHALTEGLGQFNLSVDDLTRFMQLVRDGRLALAARGKTLSDTYTAHRRRMPGQQTDTP